MTKNLVVSKNYSSMATLACPEMAISVVWYPHTAALYMHIRGLFKATMSECRTAGRFQVTDCVCSLLTNNLTKSRTLIFDLDTLK